MRFRYLRDPLFLACVAIYAINRFVLKRLSHAAFWHSYLNDVICIPFWVPILLFLMRKCRLRRDDAPPRAVEVLVPLIVWSAVFEVVLPRLGPFRGRAIADPFDVLAYTCGAAAASAIWHVYYRRLRS